MPLTGMSLRRHTALWLWLVIAAPCAIGQGAKSVAPPASDKAAGVGAAKALQAGDAQVAERLYRQAMRLNPKQADWPMGLGAALERQGRLDEALAAYRKASELAPGRPAGSDCVVRALLAGGRPEDAETEARESLKTWPDDANLRSLLIGALRKQRKWEAARQEMVSRQSCNGLWTLADEEEAAGITEEAVLALRASANCLTGVERTTAFFLLARLEEKHQSWDDLIDVYAGYDQAERTASPVGGIGAVPGFSHLAVFADQSAKAGRAEIAVKAYQKLLTTPGAGWRERSGLIDLLIAQKRYAEARRVTADGLRNGRFDYSAGTMDGIYRLDMTALSRKLADAGAFDEAVAALRDQISLDPLSASQTYSAIGKLYAGHDQWKDAAKSYAQADNGIWGGYVFRGFVTELVTSGKYDAVWDAYRGAFPGHNWQFGDLAVPAIPLEEIAKAAYQGKLLVQGGAQSLVCGLDCQVNTQNPLRIPFGQFIELADFAPVAPPNQGCGTDPMFAVEFMGGQWLTMARQLTFQLAFDSSPIRPLPAERPSLAVGIGISGGLGQSAGQSAPGQLPPLTELALGLQGRASALSGGLYTGDPEVRAVAADVFQRLLDTSVRRAGPSEPYELSLLNSPSVNAFSTAAGKVYVDSGLLSYVGKDPGMWAAALSHEIGHCVGQHQYHAYMRLYELQRLKAYYAWRMALGDKTATWFYLGTKIGGDLLNMKLSRDEESEADRTGLMMMAEAGYHPDFILALFDRLRGTTGDRSGLVTFFSSDHPRWNTREQRTAGTMDQAIEVFESHWKAPAESPGGMPPPITILETPKASVDKNAKLVQISVPYEIRHAEGSSAAIALVFRDRGKAVAAVDPRFRTEDDHLGVVRPLDVNADRVSSSLDVSIPASAVGGKSRKLVVTAVLMRNGKIDRESRPVTVNFPKP